MGAIKSKVMAVAVATALPLGLAGPAEAATSMGGCTVKPERAERAERDAQGFWQARLPVTVTCEAVPAGLKVRIQQRVYEQDSGKDQYLGSRRVGWNFPPSGGTRAIRVSLVKLPNSESGPEDVYQLVRFRVINGPTKTGWSAWEKGPVTEINA